LNVRDDQPLAELRHHAVAVLDRLGKVVTRIDVQERERKPRRPERLFGQPQEDDRVLATREQEDGSLAFSRKLSKDMNTFVFERAKVGSSERPQ